MQAVLNWLTSLKQSRIKVGFAAEQEHKQLAGSGADSCEESRDFLGDSCYIIRLSEYAPLIEDGRNGSMKQRRK